MGRAPPRKALCRRRGRLAISRWWTSDLRNRYIPYISPFQPRRLCGLTRQNWPRNISRKPLVGEFARDCQTLGCQIRCRPDNRISNNAFALGQRALKNLLLPPRGDLLFLASLSRRCFPDTLYARSSKARNFQGEHVLITRNGNAQYGITQEPKRDLASCLPPDAPIICHPRFSSGSRRHTNVLLGAREKALPPLGDPRGDCPYSSLRRHRR